MSNKILITKANQLYGQVDGIFSVEGNKAKLLGYGRHEALFSLLQDGKYQGVNAIDIKDMESKKIYKIGKMKKI